jgi:hypothetical protein
MNEAGTALMLVNKNNYIRMLNILVQVDRRGKLSPDEREFLRNLVDY